MKMTPRIEIPSPMTSAMVMAVWIDRERRSSSWLPKNCPVITAQPAPRPTLNPTASSDRLMVAWMPPSASLPPNCPTMNVLMRAYDCWKNDAKKIGTHSDRSCLQMTPCVTSMEPEFPLRAI